MDGESGDGAMKVTQEAKLRAEIEKLYGGAEGLRVALDTVGRAIRWSDDLIKREREAHKRSLGATR